MRDCVPNAASEPPAPFVNTVRIVGRMTTDLSTRALPSGDEVASWRVVVPRARGDGERTKVDVFTCASFDPAIRHVAGEWSVGDVVDVTGAMRLRFWRSADGVRSRYELEVQHARRLSCANNRMPDGSPTGGAPATQDSSE